MTKTETTTDFESWFTGIKDEIDAVQGLMSEALSENPAILYQQLTKVEAWHSRLTELLSEANSHLDLSEYEGLMKIDRNLTVLEREATLRAMVVGERRARDIIEGLCESIKNRLMLGMSLRKNNAAERTNF